ncbi:hypothetical protein BOW53_01970 [Solemya pervernicosa gill symbiont]|uniref:Uncharacterized protein n=2 Tax=Gammaproteobacteria incertae sedis TaxID=118884 RepID=A0A1T2LAI2_9GAMM|nr:hypothetical protein [Candidatus Reidiella endopervernicosa]OOZ41956.1 hypothetical protein BOW53_01970 [Solemya pervernicosa gill symbiont]QKQ24924.1 hypothetical protein HUE57_00455 [Candidatus Reidiella endopervernicosa]
MGEMMVWTMFREFHKQAKQIIGSDVLTHKPEESTISTLEESYRNNLNIEGWMPECGAYEGLSVNA